MKVRTIPGWTYLLTFGDDLDIYAQGDMRRAVDRETGRVLFEYPIKEPNGISVLAGIEVNGY